MEESAVQSFSEPETVNVKGGGMRGHIEERAGRGARGLSVGRSSWSKEGSCLCDKESSSVGGAVSSRAMPHIEARTL